MTAIRVGNRRFGMVANPGIKWSLAVGCWPAAAAADCGVAAVVYAALWAILAA